MSDSFSWFLCDCVGGSRDTKPPAEELNVVVVTFAVKNFRNWYKKFELERTVYKGVDLYLGERREGFILTDVFVDIVHLVPRPKVKDLIALYQSEDLAWLNDDLISSAIDIKEYDLIIRDDGGDLNEAELMTLVSHEVTEFAEFAHAISMHRQQTFTDTALTKSLIARDGNQALVVSLFSKRNQKHIIAFDESDPTVIQPVVSNKSTLYFKRSAADDFEEEEEEDKTQD